MTLFTDKKSKSLIIKILRLEMEHLFLGLIVGVGCSLHYGREAGELVFYFFVIFSQIFILARI